MVHSKAGLIVLYTAAVGVAVATSALVAVQVADDGKTDEKDRHRTKERTEQTPGPAPTPPTPSEPSPPADAPYDVEGIEVGAEVIGTVFELTVVDPSGQEFRNSDDEYGAGADFVDGPCVEYCGPFEGGRTESDTGWWAAGTAPAGDYVARVVRFGGGDPPESYWITILVRGAVVFEGGGEAMREQPIEHPFSVPSN
jgi:hypothetical protein